MLVLLPHYCYVSYHAHSVKSTLLTGSINQCPMLATTDSVGLAMLCEVEQTANDMIATTLYTSRATTLSV
jgi:myosin-crossreactive antigen